MEKETLYIASDNEEKIKNLCKRDHIKKLSVFGSTIHGSATEYSDIDILVEFLPGFTPGFAFVSIQDELSKILHRSVDLHTLESLSRYFRDDVLAEAVTVYAEIEE